jgi:hypothetical protein
MAFAKRAMILIRIKNNLIKFCDSKIASKAPGWYGGFFKCDTYMLKHETVLKLFQNSIHESS